ncbi:MAG TPA: hypothetical protein VN829_11575 [Dongiaceae bacterium]|nr:hypothetical protein [Dongiaceae bacterium]
MKGIQTRLNLEVPGRRPEDERLKAMIDLVVDRFDRDLMAYYDAIRPRLKALPDREGHISLAAAQLAKRS